MPEPTAATAAPAAAPTFDSLGLRPALVQAARALNLNHPTPAQQAVIPALLAGQDVLLQAPTGAGKTAAYALPLLQHWLQGRPRTPRPVRALVVVPTRELVGQVASLLRELSHGLPGLLKVAVGFGGVSINPQLMALRGGADIVVATPGRLLDLVRHNALHLDEVDLLVLDEADRLLDADFAEELQAVLALLPRGPATPGSRGRQTLLCSATWPADVQALAQAQLQTPLNVRLSPAQSRPDIRQRALTVDTARRTALLRHLLAEQAAPAEGAPGDGRALVFVASQHGAEHVATKLRQHGLKAEALHGGLSQGSRHDTLDALRQGRLQVVVATDLAARGLHIDALPLVVNYDLPRSAQDHQHRIGRTGRAGARGEAVSLVPPESEAHFRLIEKRQGLRLPREVVPGFEPTPAARDEDGAPLAPAGTGLDPNGGVKGRRPSKKDKLRQAAAAAAASAPVTATTTTGPGASAAKSARPRSRP
ncbi:DEAD/DEAH box helicase [Ideonella livida]|uniref:DEAD/DEAH box helicase n=1 Tax=Ideonella livida TaxID=2707176 RepID=A0A7C9PIY5_9BURK|nr:DEAD/DEAH box helicase [Ideonella livida]NDY93096.1 DEAD/DEAH box helicase [Ideonella livida]